MTPERAAECRRAGAAGIAAIGAFLPEGAAPGALGVAAAVRAFREALAL
jgi:thiamine monophosphate synthase